MRRGAANLAALAAIQVSNAALPLLAFPWILRAVGAGPYSRVVVAESIAVYVLSVVVYSFDIEGVARVAGLDAERDRDRISRAFSAILVTRLLLALAAGAVVLAGAMVLAPDLAGYLGAWLLYPLGYALQSLWYFQARERNAVPAAVNVVARLAAVGLVVTLVTRPEHAPRAPLILGASHLVVGVALLAFAVAGRGVRLVRVPWSEVGSLLRGGAAIFVGNVSVALYRDSNVLLAGVLGSSAAVATYSVAEKIVKALQAVARPLNQHAYPRLVRALDGHGEPSRAALSIVLRHTVPQLLALAVLLGVVAGGVPLVWHLLPAGTDTGQVRAIHRVALVMAPSVLLGVANFMLGTAALNALGRRRYLAGAILATGLANLVVASALIHLLGAMGAAMAFVLSEALLCALVLRAYRPPHLAARA